MERNLVPLVVCLVGKLENQDACQYFIPLCNTAELRQTH